MGAAEEREYICDLKVKYGDYASDAPPDALRELTGLNNSLNYGYGGKHVWLVPTYTNDAMAAATSFHVVVQTDSEKKMDDLAKGAGGGYRYMFTKSDRDEPRKIVHAVLFRTQSAVNSAPTGWDMITADINKGRRKSRLYILFKTVAEPSRTLLSIPDVSGYLSTRSSGYLTARSSAVVKNYIQRLDVHYGDSAGDMPPDAIREIHSLDSEIMFQEGGKYAWLTPVFTMEPTRAATAFDVLIQPYQDTKLHDLAKSAGGEFRYVVPRADRKLSNKIVEVGLVRSERPVKSAPSGWDGYSVINILSGRSKGFLHLVWKTVSTNSWSFVSLTTMSPFKSTGGPTPYISRLKVVYTDEIDECPEEALYEFSGQSADINYQFGGKFVWLVPEYTTDPNAAATSFHVNIQSIADLAFDDMARGAGGDYRYLQPKYDLKVRTKISEAQLLRASTSVKTAPSGWQGITKDINSGRQRTCLYVIWKCS